MSRDQELFEFSGELRHETDAAFLIFDGAREVWCPKSITEVIQEDMFSVPEWFAIKEGLA